MNSYRVKRFVPTDKVYSFDVPASKSILNRALILAALSKGSVVLSCGAFGEDTRAMLGCLASLGIKTEFTQDGVTVHGCGGNIPNKNARLDVMSAGTAARFLPAALAFCGGDYTFSSSAQMQKRPMDGLAALEKAGVKIDYMGERGKFPFRMRSDKIKCGVLHVNTETSTQYLSGLLLAAGAGDRPVTILPTGERADGSYVAMTLSLLDAFHIKWERRDGGFTVFPSEEPPAHYEVEGDLSGACYFLSLSLLFGMKIFVKRVHLQTLQGDVKFLRLLEERGVRFTDMQEGLLADGSGIASFEGFDEDFGDFSDQTLTAAALAPFAASPSRLRNVEHIKRQECDRINAIVENLNSFGVPATTDGRDVCIAPAPVESGTVKTFGDHRVAMAFTLTGLKAGNLTIDDPSCAKKTFENYFKLIGSLY